MEQRRPQGRPTRGFGDVGRDKLIQAARSLVKDKPNGEISRKDIADAAGVTPALVSYYFPDKWSLLHSATAPAISSFHSRISAISCNDIDEPLINRLVATIIDALESDGHLIDCYMEHEARFPTSRDGDEKSRAFGHLLALVEKCIDEKVLRRDDPTIVLMALWSMCRLVASKPSTLFERQRADIFADKNLDAKVDFVLQHFLTELSPGGEMPSPDGGPIDRQRGPMPLPPL